MKDSNTATPNMQALQLPLNAPNIGATLTISKSDLIELASTTNNASEAFDQLETLFKVIAEKSENHSERKSLAKIGMELASMWSSVADVEQSDFKEKYGLTERVGN